MHCIDLCVNMQYNCSITGVKRKLIDATENLPPKQVPSIHVSEETDK